jgi:hypothetical protein
MTIAVSFQDLAIKVAHRVYLSIREYPLDKVLRQCLKRKPVLTGHVETYPYLSPCKLWLPVTEYATLECPTRTLISIERPFMEEPFIP